MPIWETGAQGGFMPTIVPMGKKMAEKNRVWLNNQWTAFLAGYAPAKECIEFPGG
jgi:hypothetical protein